MGDEEDHLSYKSTNYLSLAARHHNLVGAEAGLDVVVDDHQFERSQPVIGLRSSQDDLIMVVKKEQPEANDRIQDISDATEDVCAAASDHSISRK